MKIIAWNCRGLGNSLAIRSLLNLQRKENPDILFLSETKMDERRIESLRCRLGLTNLVVKDYKGKSGGLAIFWKKEIDLHLRGVSRFYIDADVVEKDGFTWRFTGFYGEPKTDQKDLSWKAPGCSMQHGVVHGCAWEISMKSCWGVRKKAVCQKPRGVWTNLEMLWRTACWLILVLWVIHLLGGTKVTEVKIISVSGWIGLWLALTGVVDSPTTE